MTSECEASEPSSLEVLSELRYVLNELLRLPADSVMLLGEKVERVFEASVDASSLTARLSGGTNDECVVSEIG